MALTTYQHHFRPGTDPSAAPLLLLHGTGGTEHDLLPLARRISPGSALLSPRGTVLEHGAPRFFARIGEGIFDPAEIMRRTEELADFLAAAVPHYALDPTRITALGFSNGANIASALLLLRPELLAAAMLLRPMVVLEPRTLPDLGAKRVLISSGEADPIVPTADPARLATLFRRAGARVDLHINPSAGHSLVPGDLPAIRRFLSDSS